MVAYGHTHAKIEVTKLHAKIEVHVLEQPQRLGACRRRTEHQERSVVACHTNMDALSVAGRAVVSSQQHGVCVGRRDMSMAALPNRVAAEWRTMLGTIVTQGANLKCVPHTHKHPQMWRVVVCTMAH